MDLNKIKLIIWDLDETFWKGTISEGEVEMVKAHCDFVRTLNDRGIMNSICSKNDFDTVRQRLNSEGMWDSFVFPSIDWTPKSKRIANIIQRMALRPVNVLFIDDNPMNLNEAKYYIPDLNVLNVENISEILNQASTAGKDDRQHKRLKQYRQLEKKVEASIHFESTDDFLRQSNITVDIDHDCKPHLERIAEMVQRTNQLNFTKLRSTSDKLQKVLENARYECGIVSVRDKYGDYGLVGFYALDLSCRRLLHFLFSCRTMGMGIEQYVYEQLGFPELEIQGDVSGTLEREHKVHWVNINESEGNSAGHDRDAADNAHNCRILLKGPCDLSSAVQYMSGNKNCKIETEFNYVNPQGVAVTGMNHTEMMIEGMRLSDEEIGRVLRDAPFMDAGAFKTKLRDNDFDVVVMSVLPDCHEGIYRHRDSSILISFSSFNYDFTDAKNWDKIIGNKITNHNFHFTEACLKQFKDKFEFEGTLPSDRIVENVRYIREKVLKPESLLVLILGSEAECQHPDSDEFMNHANRHKEVNTALKEAFGGTGNVMFINITDLISNQSDFKGATNHFSRSVYYKLAGCISDCVSDYIGTGKIGTKSPLKVLTNKIIGKINNLLRR